MNVQTPEPRRHAPPAGWPPEVFEQVTDALAAALVAALRRLATPCRQRCGLGSLDRLRDLAGMGPGTR